MTSMKFSSLEYFHGTIFYRSDVATAGVVSNNGRKKGITGQSTAAVWCQA
jgi:hypothetical protein